MKKTLLLLVVVTMLASALTIGVAAANAAEFTDLPDTNHWSYEGVVSVIENGIMEGVGGGKFEPDRTITLAEASAYLVRVMKATAKASEMPGISGYVDGSWYDKQGVVSIAFEMGILDGIVAAYRTVMPETTLTSEDAFDMMARVLKIAGGAPEILESFADADLIKESYRLNIAGLVGSGYILCSNDAGVLNLNPRQPITRARFATVFGRVFQQYITKAGEYEQDDIFGKNVVINVAGVTLKDLTIDGDLFVGDGVGSGPVILNNVKINGRLVARSQTGSVFSSGGGSAGGSGSADAGDGDDNNSANNSANGSGNSANNSDGGGSSTNGNGANSSDGGGSGWINPWFMYAYLLENSAKTNSGGVVTASFITDDGKLHEDMVVISGINSVNSNYSRFYKLVDISWNNEWFAIPLTVPGGTVFAGYYSELINRGFGLSSTINGSTDLWFEYAETGMRIVSVPWDYDSELKYEGTNSAIASIDKTRLIVILVDDSEAKVAFVFKADIGRIQIAGLS